MSTQPQPNRPDRTDDNDRLNEAIALLENVDWRHVDGVSAAEAAQLTQRLANATVQGGTADR